MFDDLLQGKCATSMYYLKSLSRNGCSDNELLLAFNAFVLCHATYAWPVFQDCMQSEKNLILGFEKKLFAMCHKKQIRRMNDILNNICQKLMHKIIKNFHSHPISNFFALRNENNYNLRRRVTLIPSFYQTRFSRNSFLKFYNSY